MSLSGQTILTEDFRKLAEKEQLPIQTDTNNLKKIIRDVVLRAAVLKQQQRYAESIIELLDVIDYDSSASIFHSIAHAYYYSGKVYNARNYALKAIKADSSFIPAYELLFETYYYQKAYSDALTVAEQMYKLSPTHENKIRFASLHSVKNPSEAVKMLEDMIGDSTDVELMISLADAYINTEQVDKAILIYEKLFLGNPENFEIAQMLLSSYLIQNQHDNLFNTLEKVEKFYNSKQVEQLYEMVSFDFLNLEPSKYKNSLKKFLSKIDERFYFSWVIQGISGNIAGKILDTNKVIEHYSRALSLNDSSSMLYIDYAISYSNLKMIDSSIKYLNIGKLKFSGDLMFDFYLANTYMLKKDYNTALEFTSNLLKSDSSNVLFLTTHASILQELKKYDESDLYYTKALMIDPRDPLANNNFAYSLSLRNMNLNKALRMSQLSLEIEPENSAYLDTYGWIQYQLGNYDTALEYVQKAIEKNEASAEVFDHLGDIYIKFKESDKALEMYKKSLEVEPNNKVIIDKIDKLKNN
ncbi:tetratricopeptide repeat protein [Candidatus Kapaibacterium sp.]